MSGFHLSFTTLDPAGSEGSFPTGINTLGQVTGFYFLDGVQQGFVDDDGTISEITVPNSAGTAPNGINNSGQITGDYSGRDGTADGGFIDTTGTIAGITVPGAVGTSPEGINDAGQVVGVFQDGSLHNHGFVDAGGIITSFNVPGATDTLPRAINDVGQIIGEFWDSTGGERFGFLDTAGSFVTIEPTGATAVVPKGINTGGQIAGYYHDGDGLFHGFVYSAGTITSIDVPGASATFVTGINDAGEVVGYYTTASGNHGYVDIAGTIDTFDVSGAISTTPTGINSAGQIVGNFKDAAATNEPHGFIATPCYCAGTRIATERGAVPVEQLRPGDRVLSAFGGTVPVVWIGFRNVDCRRHPRPQEVWPIRVRAGAFFEAVPERDLLLSPDHAVYIDEVLIPVRFLLNDFSITRQPVDLVTYFHIELPSHDVILAEGLPAESYLDTGNRGAFENGGPVRHLHPDFAQEVWHAEACAAQITHGPILDVVTQRLRARARILVQGIALPSSIANALNPQRA